MGAVDSGDIGKVENPPHSVLVVAVLAEPPNELRQSLGVWGS
jgi:hypothetical protein